MSLFWHWLLVRLGLRKKCPCKKEWQAVRCENDARIYYICVGCLRGWHIEKSDKISDKKRLEDE